ncbi:hypothetical protein E2C01_037900 [Portunus trituberculatus]|uniref:Uncharacterized protein n=1 Tax=Portunus trituberculatus TaxID=210409 RepID=A0A5B7FGI4_PORTR|nr:hypothetical protein [Portunus trituberculatus]
MERLLHPEHFEGSEGTGAAEWTHWICTFENFIVLLLQDPTPDRLKLLINYISPTTFSHITDCPEYEEPINILKRVYTTRSGKSTFTSAAGISNEGEDAASLQDLSPPRGYEKLGHQVVLPRYFHFCNYLTNFNYSCEYERDSFLDPLGYYTQFPHQEET